MCDALAHTLPHCLSASAVQAASKQQGTMYQVMFLILCVISPAMKEYTSNAVLEYHSTASQLPPDLK